MRIIEDVKLDFNDVLIKPKRSTLTTRKDANLTRRFTFRHSKNDWTGVPIIAANMPLMRINGKSMSARNWFTVLKSTFITYYPTTCGIWSTIWKVKSINFSTNQLPPQLSASRCAPVVTLNQA